MRTAPVTALEKNTASTRAVSAAVGLTFFILIFLAEALPAAAAPGSRNTNVTVESSEKDIFSSVNSHKTDRFGFAIDDSTSLGINEDGDPNLNVAF